MALFVPVIIGLPIGYFTWAKVFDTVDNSVYQITQKKEPSTISTTPHSGTWDSCHAIKPTQKVSIDGGITDNKSLVKPPNSKVAAGLGALVSVGLLSKVTFTPQTRHRLFFAQAPPNSNIRIVTLKLGIELLVRSGIVFYGGASGGAIAGRLAASSSWKTISLFINCASSQWCNSVTIINRPFCSLDKLSKRSQKMGSLILLHAVKSVKYKEYVIIY